MDVNGTFRQVRHAPTMSPQARRSMWEWTRKVNFAATPAMAT
jgi:hypothetical protein